MADTQSNLEKFIDHLPYSDGTGRRRFIAGGIFVIGMALINQKVIIGYLTDIKAIDIITSPVIAAGIVLLVYAVGSIIEMFGDLFLVRAASGIFWGIEIPVSYYNQNIKSKKFSIFKWFLLIVIVWSLPLTLYFMFIIGLFGYSRYQFKFDKALSATAISVAADFPAKVKEGLYKPVDDYNEISFKYLIEQLPLDYDRKWAKALFNRAKEVSVITTSLLILLTIFVLSGNINKYYQPGSEEVKLQAEIDSIYNLNKIQGDSLELRSINKLKRSTQLSSKAKFSYDSLRTVNEHADRVLKMLTLENAISELKKQKPITDEIGIRINYLSKQLKIQREFHALLGIDQENKPENNDTLPAEDPNFENDKDRFFANIKLRQSKVDQFQYNLTKFYYKKLFFSVLFLLPFIFLYLGFFRSLKNAIISVIEIIAIKKQVL